MTAETKPNQTMQEPETFEEFWKEVNQNVVPFQINGHDIITFEDAHQLARLAWKGGACEALSDTMKRLDEAAKN